MTRYLGALVMGLLLFAVGKARGGWPGGLFAGSVSAFLALYLGTLIRGKAMRQAPAAPPMLPGETPLLHGPVKVLEDEGAREAWAYLSDQRLSLLPSDGAEGFSLALKDVQELRPAPRRLIGSGPLGLVAGGRLWQLKVPDQERWMAALKTALHGAA